MSILILHSGPAGNIMRIDDKYKLREIAGVRAVIVHGAAGADMTRIISLNESAAYIWEKFYGRDFTLNDIALALAENYGIPEDRAETDAAAWCGKMKDCGLIHD